MQPWQARAENFHPHLIDAVDALPPKLREVAETALPPGEQVERGFVVPADYRSPDGIAPSRVVPAQALLFTTSGVLYVQAETLGAEDIAAPVFLQPDKLLWMRSSHLLLHGKLELLGARNGQAARLEMEFNAVGWRLMQTEWHQLVRRAIGVPLPPVEQNGEAAEDGAYTLDEQTMLLLDAVPDKFIDGLGRYALYTGEKLLGIVFQPALWKENLIAFDEQLVPNTLMALTGASVLILAEEPALVRKSEQLGLMITRIPRRALAAVELVAEDSLQTVRLMLAQDGVGAEDNVRLGPAAVEAWQELWSRQ